MPGSARASSRISRWKASGRSTRASARADPTGAASRSEPELKIRLHASAQFAPEAIGAARSEIETARRGWGERSPRRGDQRFENGLLRVQAVLRLVEHERAFGLDHLGGDLLAAVGGETVEDTRAGRGGEQLRVHLERAEHRAARVGLALLSHAGPGVGVEEGATLHRLPRVGAGGELRAGLRRA